MIFDQGHTFDARPNSVKLTFDGSSVEIPHTILDVGRLAMLEHLSGGLSLHVARIQGGVGGYGHYGQTFETELRDPNEESAADRELEDLLIETDVHNIIQVSPTVYRYSAPLLTPVPPHSLTEFGLVLSSGHLLAKAIYRPNHHGVLLAPSSTEPVLVEWTVDFSGA